MVHVTVTGLRLKRLWHWPTFMRHAVTSFRQAKAAPGCLRAEARSVKGVQHTLTIWASPAAARAYATTGAHLRAMRIFDRIATGRVIAWEAQTAPDWDQALARWRAETPEA